MIWYLFSACCQSYWHKLNSLTESLSAVSKSIPKHVCISMIWYLIPACCQTVSMSEDFIRWVSISMVLGQIRKIKGAGPVETSWLVLRAWNLFQSIRHAPENNYSGAVFLVTPSQLGDRSIWSRGASIFRKFHWPRSPRTRLQTDAAPLVACFCAKNTQTLSPLISIIEFVVTVWVWDVSLTKSWVWTSRYFWNLRKNISRA